MTGQPPALGYDGNRQITRTRLPGRADMTKKIHVHLIDDLDASEASETVRFEVDGRNYEIDLSSRNAQKFRAEIAPYITHARRPARPGRHRLRPPARPGPGGLTRRRPDQRRAGHGRRRIRDKHPRLRWWPPPARGIRRRHA